MNRVFTINIDMDELVAETMTEEIKSILMEVHDNVGEILFNFAAPIIIPIPHPITKQIIGEVMIR